MMIIVCDVCNEQISMLDGISYLLFPYVGGDFVCSKCRSDFIKFKKTVKR